MARPAKSMPWTIIMMLVAAIMAATNPACSRRSGGGRYRLTRSMAIWACRPTASAMPRKTAQVNSQIDTSSGQGRAASSP
jgi:hypothetical protein